MSVSKGKTYQQRKASLPDVVKEAIASKDVERMEEFLTPLQKAFSYAYISCFNATQAIKEAGYNTNNHGKIAHQLLNNPRVRAFIDQLLINRSDLITVDVNYVVHKITRAMEKSDAAGKYNEVLRGAELLARYLGMFIERHEVTGKDGGPIEYEKVKEDADAFSRSIAGLASRNESLQTIN